MISKTSWQPEGLHWEIKMHPVLPQKREQPEAFHCPHPSSNKPAKQNAFSPTEKKKKIVLLLVKPAAEEPGFQGGDQEKGSPCGETFQKPLVLGRSRMCAGWQLQRKAWLTGSCRPCVKPQRGFWCFPKVVAALSYPIF